MDKVDVMKGLARCQSRYSDFSCDGCPYSHDRDCVYKLIKDAKEKLEEREPVKPTKNAFKVPLMVNYGFECECTAPLLKDQPYCMNCGRAVKWE